MQIFKYLSLLLLLTFITFCIFIATLSPKYEVKSTKIIKSPRATVFNYINDFSNLESFSVYKINNSDLKFQLKDRTSGLGASCLWEGADGAGKIKTTFVKENDSLVQKVENNGETAEIYWVFKDTLGKTKITYITKGEISFVTKIKSALQGGITRLMRIDQEKSLSLLDKTLDYEINTFKINVDGLVQKPGGFILQKTINTKPIDVARNIRILISNLDLFIKNNKIQTIGAPFVQYNSPNMTAAVISITVGVPINQEIITSPGSDVIGENKTSFTAIKTTLTGDYSHLKAAREKAIAYINKNNLLQDHSKPVIEVFVKSKKEHLSPSKWITEIYIPIKSENYNENVVSEPTPAPEEIP